uniref:Zinc finger MYM-type protein 1 n=1 Tax=Sipha flava TaxID=143950 RepID=A0A2S2RBD0_9HEMI
MLRCNKQKQMTLCERFVKNVDVIERFLGFIDCSKNQDAESLYHYILEYLKKCKLSSKPQIVAQSYDGANFLPGKFSGLQNKIKNPYAIYIHCMAHKMNLIVIGMCKYVKVMNIYIHLKSS